MNVTCPSCGTVYRVDPQKVPPAGIRARCAVCPAVFGVYAEPGAPGVPTPTARPVVAAVAPAVPATPRMSPPPPPPRRPTPPPVSAPAAPPPARPAPRPTMPPVARTPGNRPSIPPQSIGRFGSTGPSRTAAPSAPAAPAGAPPRPPVNPFLSRDPGQKARRLARALVSDLVVYNPEKRKAGLRDGNLKDVFADEIQKSWLEYTEQVGKELAETTPHFTDALNEILGDGSKMF